MINHTDLTDEQFEKQFADLTFDPALFSHEAHLRLAWIHIRKYGLSKAIDNVCHQIREFATSAGVPGKYNRTVTEAGVRVVYHFYLKAPRVGFAELLQMYPRLEQRFMELLKAHYSFDIFAMAEAKQRYLQPDLLPFD